MHAGLLSPGSFFFLSCQMAIFRGLAWTLEIRGIRTIDRRRVKEKTREGSGRLTAVVCTASILDNWALT